MYMHQQLVSPVPGMDISLEDLRDYVFQSQTQLMLNQLARK